MGQNGSKVQVHVQVDRPYYYTGDVVTGAVAFHCEHAIEFNKINLKVSGVEKCEWSERHGSGDNAHTEHYSGKKEVFKQKLPLMGSGTLNPGDYQWPFSFQLPQNIPGSFNYSSGGTKASITYKIKADCDQSGLMKPDYKKTIKLEVLQRHKAAPPAPLALHGEEPISFFCCFSKGIIGLKVTGDTDTYLPGEHMELKAQVDNKSTTEVPCVEFRLQQHVRLTAKTLFGERNKNFTVTRIFQKQQMSGFPNGAPGSVSDYPEVKLHMEKNLEATCHSQLIHSTYELEVKAKTGCCLSEVVLRKPILLNDPQPVESPPAVVPPQGWAPQMYPTFQFSVPNPEGYTFYGSPQAPQAPPPPQQAAASITYNITNVTNNNGYSYPDPVKAGPPGSPGPTVSVYQEGYGAGVGVGVQPPREVPGWGSPEPGAPVMPGAVGYPPAQAGY